MGAVSSLVPTLAPMHVRPFAPAEVTSIHHAAEVDPREVGLTADDVNEMWGAIVRLYQTGLHPAIALDCRHHQAAQKTRHRDGQCHARRH